MADTESSDPTTASGPRATDFPPSRMHAAVVETLGGPEAIRLRERPVPRAQDDEVLVRVHAAGVAFPALLQSRGEYQVRPELPFVPGSEIAGDVLAAPPDSGLRPGERVFAFCRGGAFAEVAAPKAAHTFPLPERLSYVEGAALPMNYLTAHFAAAVRGGLQPGESVLVQGAAGGLGSAAVQVAKAFGASRVVAIVSTPTKGAVAEAAGADQVVLADGFKDAVLAAGPVDLVLDPVGGDRFVDSLRCLAPGGRLVVLGFTGGTIPELRVNRLLLANTGVLGAAWGPWVLAEPARMAAQFAALEPHLHGGALTPVVGDTYPLDRVADALHTLDERRATGKVVVTM